MTSQYIAIITILSIIICFYFMKYKEQSVFIDENKKLKKENKKIKLELKYLQQYKTDISKTFKILNTELNLISNHIKNEQQPTSNILNSLISTGTTDIFNNMINQFLTSDEIQQEQQQEHLQEHLEDHLEDHLQEHLAERQQEHLQEHLQDNQQEHLQINYVPLNGHYSQLLLRQPIIEYDIV